MARPIFSAWVLLLSVVSIMLAATGCAQTDPKIETRAALDRVADRIESIGQEVANPTEFECFGYQLVVGDSEILYAQAEQAWAAGDYSKARELVNTINTKLDGIPVPGGTGRDYLLWFIIGANVLMVAGVVVFAFRRKKSHQHPS